MTRLAANRLLLLAMLPAVMTPQERSAELKLSFTERQGPMEMDRFALGQGGLSEQPLWLGREAEIRALRPRVIRLFVQEYFNVLPAKGRYDFRKLDESVDLITRSGSTPLMAIVVKPKVLFPVIDHDLVEPNDWRAWEELIFQMVKHYRQRGSGIRYWEVGNEPDLGETGGCPYRFKPDAYARYYQHTAAAVLRADPEAKVGGPALANPNSPILPALLEFCVKQKVRLDFVSWHIYSSDPLRIRGTIDKVKALLKQHPTLHPETFLNEWNMSLSNPVQDPRFQPCFIAEVAWQMKDGGLDYACYYHIRDYHVSAETFSRFFSPRGAAFMARWWNRMPQFDGLFDYQNNIRPSYFMFKLLSRLDGERLAAVSNDARVHAFLTDDRQMETFNLTFWNYSSEPVRLRIVTSDLPSKRTAHRVRLDAETASNDENHRLRPLPPIRLEAGAASAEVRLEPYAVESWYLETRR